jgi:HK97 family phage major capsid protein
MNDKLNKVKQDLHETFRSMQTIQEEAEKAGEWSAVQREEWDKHNVRADALETEHNALVEDGKRAARMADLNSVDYRQVVATGSREVAVPDEGERQAELYDTAFRAFMRGGMRSLNEEQREAMERRASPQNIATPADGGYLVPPGYRTIMTETMKAYGGLINYANVITTTTGNPLQWPTNDDTGNIGAILSENSTLSEVGVTVGTRSVGAYTYTSKLVRVSLQLLQDSAFNLDTWLPKKLGQRIGRAVAADLINGTGTGQPTGILPTSVNSGVSVTNANFLANTTGLGYDAIIGLEHSVDPAYREMGNCRFLFNDSTLATLRKFKDAQGRPLWVPVPVPGMAAQINGQNYAIDQSMPSIAAAAKSILYGDFEAGFLVRQALDVQAVRLSERYADALQIGFFAFMRLDSVPDDSAAVRYLTTS